MSSPSVDLTIPDNQLGIRAPSSAILAIIGTSSSGTIATPAAFANIPDVVAAFGGGPLVEHAAYAIERYGLTVLCCRATGTTAGAYGAVTLTGTGTSVPTGDASVKPDNDYDLVIKVVVGGTIGITGITYQTSLDGGVTYGPVLSLGVANSITFTDGSCKINLGAGTLVAGDLITSRTAAPKWDSAALGVALDAVRLTQSTWTFLDVCGDLDSTAVSTIDASLEAMRAAGRMRRAMGHFRRPTAGETEADYRTAFQTAFGASACKRLAVAAGWAAIDSSVSRRRYVRPVSLAAAPLQCAVSEEIDIAEIQFGPLPGVAIRDGNGNVLHHDETASPGLDNDRALTLRTWEGRGFGAFVNNPRLLSPAGSDYVYTQLGRVIDLASTISKRELEPLLSKGVTVIPDGSGRITEEDAAAIEGIVNAALVAELTGLRKCTTALFSLSRTDNVLTTGTISWQTRVVPLAYLKKLVGKVALVASDKAPATVL